MSALSKVASFVLLVDQKLHSLLSAVHYKVADRAYNAAEATFQKNRDKSTLLSVNANKQQRERIEQAHRAHAANLKKIMQSTDAALEKADQLLEDAEVVRLKYEAVGDVTFTKAAILKDEAKKRSEIRLMISL